MRSEEKSLRNSSADTKVKGGGGGGGGDTPGTGTDSRAAHGEDHDGAAIYTTVHAGPHTTAGGYVLREIAACGGPTQEQV